MIDFDLSTTVRPTDPSILLDCGPPRALYKVNPRNILGKKWWDNARKTSYSNYMNTCAACGASRVKLYAHELYNIDSKAGKIYLKDVVPLCNDCHSYIHREMHRSLLRAGKLKYSDVRRILDHGKRVLKKAGLKEKYTDPNKCSVKQSDWRLVLEGKEYAPVFEEYKEEVCG